MSPVAQWSASHSFCTATSRCNSQLPTVASCTTSSTFDHWVIKHQSVQPYSHITRDSVVPYTSRNSYFHYDREFCIVMNLLWMPTPSLNVLHFLIETRGHNEEKGSFLAVTGILGWLSALLLCYKVSEVFRCLLKLTVLCFFSRQVATAGLGKDKCLCLVSLSPQALIQRSSDTWDYVWQTPRLCAEQFRGRLNFSNYDMLIRC